MNAVRPDHTYANHSNILLEIKNISVDYHAANGTVHALTDVSITLERGQILGLAGESGSGKSTLAYAITRLLRSPAEITAGQLLYYPRPRDGEDKGRLKGSSRATARVTPKGTTTELIESAEAVDILQFSPAELREFRWNELSIVFQSAMNALNPVLNIGAQITDVLRTHRPEMGPDSRKQRAIELLRLVGIAPDRIRSYPHELSGGMRQRAIIAIALALSPELIIMDEPTTALDVVVQREILMEIMSLRELLNFSVIFITHDLSLLLEMADKIAIMYAGRIVEMATSRELHQQPRHPYSYGLLNSFPTLHGPRRRMTGIPGSPPDLRDIPPGCAFHPRCPMAFEACSTILPKLLPSTSETPEQLVACHLYDPRFKVGEIPTKSDFATNYEAKYLAAQGSRKVR
ncbi:MAG: ABC transporter ATP-binding protein [Ktedonobacteraceae bacterium]